MRQISSLTFSDVDKMLTAARNKAISEKLAIAIAIVDEGGYLLGLLRFDGASRITGEVATGKARTAALMRRPSKVVEKMVEDHPPYVRIPHILPMAGGLPIVWNDECVGAVGVTGASAEQDEAVAQAAIDALR